VTSARDDIWIDMVQFDVRAADRLWEGIPPAQGAPEWYDDVSDLIETASGPAEPHELVDEPVVVEDMHQTTRCRSVRRCRHRRTVGRLIALKAAAATTASVLGVAAAAAATTGLVATVVVPVIEEHVLPADYDQEESATPAAPRAGDSSGSPDTGPEGRAADVAAAPTAGPATPASPQPADPEPSVGSASADPTEPVPAPDSAMLAPAVADPPPPPAPAAVTPAPPPPTDLAPLAVQPPVAQPPKVQPPVAQPPKVQAPAVEPSPGQRWSDKRDDAGACGRHACSGRDHHGGHNARHRGLAHRHRAG
jgi:hypothetical protein